jgi:hypothetical protein
MLRSIAPSNTWAALRLCLSSADFITITVEPNFRYRQRAAAAENPKLKMLFLQVAAQYRDLALQIDDPKQWREKLAAAANANKTRA